MHNPKNLQYFLYFLLFLNFLFVFFISPLRYKTKKSYFKNNTEQSIIFLQKQNPNIPNNKTEKFPYYAISRIIKRMSTFNNTSCKVSAQYILYTIAGIDEKEDLNFLELTNNTDKDLQNIKDKINKNHIIQIEIKPNHHFIIFKKNDTHLYLLQGFQDIYYLKDWMKNEEVMKPHWTIDEFFETFKELLNVNTKIERMMELLRILFFPDYFSTDNEKIQKFNNWFNYRLPVYLINVNYVEYRFINKGVTSQEFHDDFLKAARNYSV